MGKENRSVGLDTWLLKTRIIIISRNGSLIIGGEEEKEQQQSNVKETFLKFRNEKFLQLNNRSSVSVD